MNKIKLFNIFYNKNKKTLFWFSLIIFILFFIVFNFLPFLYTIDKSFRVYSPIDKINYTHGIENFLSIFNDNQFKIATRNSTLLFFIATPLSLVISLFLALVIFSLSSKLSKNIWITTIYSQFFVSSFAIGITFSYLFGEKNIAFKYFFNSDKSFVGEPRIDIIWLYLIFQLWRSIPFNTVLFVFSIQRSHNTYEKNIKIDNLSLYDKIKIVYFKEINHTLATIFITNLIFSFFLFPPAIIDANLERISGHTLSSYIYGKIIPLDGSINLDFAKASAASVISIIYILFLLLIFFMLKPKNIKKFFYWVRRINVFYKNNKRIS
ncbi:sugar ABC transporter permease [Mycoplasmopsis cricetuli]|uniref:sugar ABC transporter permease n=1 Tax=Mycoplasmopsis cricetuli TaxID=171283 RepID=UPI00046F3B27|nr:sugar ABC transporter permease [Mycoplasmopsis cricetuli]